MRGAARLRTWAAVINSQNASGHFSQATIQPTECDVLYDLRCVGSPRMSRKLLQNLFGSAVTAEFSRLGGCANHGEAES